MVPTIKSTHRYYGKKIGVDPSLPASYAPLAVPAEFCVIHCTEGYRAYDEQIFLGDTDRQASINFYITKDPVEVIQYVPPGFRAWHAGRSMWKLDGKVWGGTQPEDPTFNDFSIGIELGSWSKDYPKAEHTTYTPAQMRALVELHRDLQVQFPILKDPKRTVGHDDISGFRGKTDPGPRFDWAGFRKEAFGSDHDEEFSVRVDGVKLPSKLIMVEGKAYLPLRSIAEALGLEVSWYAQDKRVELKKKDGPK